MITEEISRNKVNDYQVFTKTIMENIYKYKVKAPSFNIIMENMQIKYTINSRKTLYIDRNTQKYYNIY